MSNRQRHRSQRYEACWRGRVVAVGANQTPPPMARTAVEEVAPKRARASAALAVCERADATCCFVLCHQRQACRFRHRRHRHRRFRVPRRRRRTRRMMRLTQQSRWNAESRSRCCCCCCCVEGVGLCRPASLCITTPYRTSMIMGRDGVIPVGILREREGNIKRMNEGKNMRTSENQMEQSRKTG